MKSVLISLKVNDFFIKKSGILDRNTLIFEDNNTNYMFDIENLTLTRKNNEICSTIDFLNKNFTYCLNELSDNNKISSKIIIKQLLNENSSVIINYRIEEDEFNLILSYEEV